MSAQFLVKYDIVRMGTDPELFLTRDGEIIGSERVIPKEGLIAGTMGDSSYKVGGKIVRDGVQLELHPNASHCRQAIGSSLGVIFRRLAEVLDDAKVDFRGVVDVSRKELDALAAENRVLGCAPSQNVHDADASIKVDGAAYQVRSAGGHIHFSMTEKSAKERIGLIPLLDIIVGNTCVLLDPDPRAAERREVYGRAGEYRLPSYGIEYRTLSNFWLRSYPLMGLVFGLARITHNLFEAGHSGAVMKLIDPKKIITAINKADKTLALENFKQLEPLFKGLELDWPESGDKKKLIENRFPIHAATYDNFVSIFLSRSITEWFPEDPLTHWTRPKQRWEGNNIHFQTEHGWESWFTNIMFARELELSQKAA